MPGESAARESERLRAKRQAFIRERFWLIAGFTAVAAIILGVLTHVLLDTWWVGAGLAVVVAAGKLAPTQREHAFARGAEGERIVGAALDRLASESVVVLHDRLIPRPRANIDHILVGPTGVWSIDAKRYKGRIEARRGGRELWVNGRNRSKLLDQSDCQVSVVRDVLERAGYGGVPVRGALCFTMELCRPEDRYESGDEVVVESSQESVGVHRYPRRLQLSSQKRSPSPRRVDWDVDQTAEIRRQFDILFMEHSDIRAPDATCEVASFQCDAHTSIAAPACANAAGGPIWCHRPQ